MRTFIRIVLFFLTTILVRASGEWNTKAINYNGYWLNASSYQLYASGDSLLVYYGLYNDRSRFFVRYTSDGGASWNFAVDNSMSDDLGGVQLNSADYKDMHMSFLSPQTLILYSVYKPLTFTSDDWGKSWRTTEVKLPLNRDTIKYGVIMSAMDTINQVYVATSKTDKKIIYITGDGWKTYDSVDCKNFGTQIFQVGAKEIFTQKYGYIYYSRDAGKTWNKSNNRIGGETQYADRFAIDSKKKIILAGVSCKSGDRFNSKICKSTDGGETWSTNFYAADQTLNGLSGGISLSPSGAGVAVAEQSFAPGPYYLKPCVYITKDFGDTWEQTSFNDTLKKFGYTIECSAGSLHNMWAYIMPYLYKYDTDDTIAVKVEDRYYREISSVSLSPNPVVQGTPIKLYLGELKSSKIKITFYDAMGKSIDSFESSNAPENIYYTPESILSKGVYYFVIEASGDRIIKNIIIE